MLTRRIGRYLSWPINRLSALIAPTGIPPNVITWSALVVNLWAAILFAAGRFAAAGGMMILAGLCDLLDGPVARRQGRVSLFGGFLDSILDRYADLILFLGLLIYYVHVNFMNYLKMNSVRKEGVKDGDSQIKFDEYKNSNVKLKTYFCIEEIFANGQVRGKKEAKDIKNEFAAGIEPATFFFHQASLKER